MEDQTTWKAHSLTLIVFTGIVVLCSIFFILGMLVGRAQGQKLSGTLPIDTPLKLDAKAAAKEDDPAFTFYDTVKKETPTEFQPAAAKPEPEPLPVPADPPKKQVPAAEPPLPPVAESGNAVNYQIGALRKQPDAERLLKEARKKGFRAFILMPVPGEANPFYRVQVGPIRDSVEAQAMKKRLESAGYQPILKK
jgi:cell division septation protein DedD